MNSRNAIETPLSTELSKKKNRAVYPNLPYLSHIRRQVSSLKGKHPCLIKRELYSHHSSMVEYSQSHFEHILELDTSDEDLKTIASNFALQPQVNTRMRSLIFDFIMYSHTRLNLCTATLFLTFDILDRYASKFIIKSGSYQLLALTALWISSKYWDTKLRVVNLGTLCQLCCDQYTKDNFKDMELHILKSLDWNLFKNSTYDSFIDMLLFLNNNDMENTHEKEGDFDVANVLNSNLNINEVKLGAILLCELVSFDINLCSKYSTYTVTKAVLTLLTLSMNYQHFNKWDNMNDVCKDPETLVIMNALLQVSTNSTDFPSSFKFKHFNSKTETKEKQSTTECLLEGLTTYNTQLQAQEFSRLQQFDMFNDPFSHIFNDNNVFTFNNENDENTPVIFSTPQPGSITPISASSSSASPILSISLANNKQVMSSINEFSRSSPISTYSNIPNHIPRNKSLYIPITPTTPTMFRKPSIKRLSTTSSISGGNLIYQRKRSSTSSEVQFEVCGSETKR